MMAQKITTICDRHLEITGEEVEGQGWTFGASPEGVESPEIYTVDLCEECSKDLVDTVRMVRELGRPLNPRRRRRGHHGKAPAPAADEVAHACPFPDCGRAFPTRQGVAMHVTRAHGVRLLEYEAERG
jgi:hypothetical protein